jgi:Aldehyde dehydrogenase family
MEAGEALCTDPRIAMIAFTGSTAHGRRVDAPAGEHLKRVSLEPGGKNSIIIPEDADWTMPILTRQHPTHQRSDGGGRAARAIRQPWSAGKRHSNRRPCQLGGVHPVAVAHHKGQSADLSILKPRRTTDASRLCGEKFRP